MARNVEEQGFIKAKSRAGFGSRYVSASSLPTEPGMPEIIVESELGETSRGKPAPVPGSNGARSSSSAKPTDNPSILPAARSDGP
jgi:hypothetical protein